MLATLALLMGGPITAAAGDDLPDVHSSCQSEPTRESTEGTARAQLTVQNLTDAPFNLYWLDYDGERVSYQVSRPHSTQTQPTWITHPWILTDPQGACYLLIVMTSVQQTMTIGTTTGETLESFPAATPDPVQPTDCGPAATGPGAQEPGNDGNADPEPGFPTPLVIAALAMMGVAVGVLLAAGKFAGRKPGGKPGSKP